MSNKYLARKYQREWAPDVFRSGGVDPEDTIYLNIGDPDIITPKVVLDEAFADGYAGHTKYTDTRGYPELRSEICRFYQGRYGMDVRDENVCVVTSGQFGMYIACQACLDPGDEVLIIEPYFMPYSDAVEMAGGVPVLVSTRFEEGFQINIDRLEEAVTPKTKALIINNPNNPTGAAYTLETLERVAEFVKKHDLVVFADDIYTSFDYTKKFIPIASLDGMFERTVTVNSGSKNFVMTGMRIGNIVADSDIIMAAKWIVEATTYSAPSISQRAMLHAFRHFDEFEEEIAKTFKERVDYAYERLSKMPMIDVLPVNGTFYVFPSVEKTGMDGAQFTSLLKEKCHIKVIPGIAFGPSGKNHFRISCTVSLADLKEALDRMEKLLIELETAGK